MAVESVSTGKTANATPRSNASLQEAAKKLFGDHPENVVGAIDGAAERLFQLAALFKAIGDALPEHSDARTLTSMGEYLAHDSGNDLDCQRERYMDAMKRATQGLAA